MVGEDAVGDGALDQIGRDVRLVGVDEAADDIVAAVELGDGAKRVLVKEALCKGTALPFFPIRRFWPSMT